MITATSIDGAAFMKLLMAQLTHQNPMDPVSNSDMLMQISQLATVEGINKMVTNLEASQIYQLATVEGIERMGASFMDVLKFAELSSGVGLVGREVEYTYDDVVDSGIVDSVSMSDAGIRLMIDGNAVELDNVTQVF